MKIEINNLNIYYEVYNENNNTDKASVLLLHGWGADHKYFLPIINTIKEKYKTFTLDLPGHGESDALIKSFSVDDYKDIIIKFINAMSIKDIILIGHSYGGRIIIKINSEVNLPFNIEKNILIDSAGIKPKTTLSKTIKITSYKIGKFLLNLIPDKNKREERLNELKKKFGSSDYINATPIMRETLVKSVNEDLSPLLKNMKETLLIWGDKDTATPLYDGEYMEKEINNAGLVVLKGTGHFSFVEDSYTFDKVIRSYLNI